MTLLTKDNIKQMKEELVGKTISDFYYDNTGDYFVIEFQGGGDVNIHFLGDEVQPKKDGE